MSESGERNQPLQGVLGDLRVYPAFEPDRQPMTAVLSVTDEELARYGSQPGRLTTSMSIPLQQSRVIAVLPLREHASLDLDRMRIEIVRVQRRHDGCRLVLRQWQVSSLLALREYRQHDYVLRNLARGEAVVGNVEHPGLAVSPNFPFVFGLTLAQPGNEGFALRHIQVDYGRRWPGQPEQLRTDAQWLDGADLVVVETAAAGTITRSISIEDFRMQAPEPQQ